MRSIESLLQASSFQHSHHLSERDLLPMSTRCPLCGGSRRSPAARIQEEPCVELLLCSDCGAASASRMPTAAALAAYYGGYYSAGQHAHVTIDAPERLASHIASRAAKQRPALVTRNPVRVLDFGGGDGTIGQLVASTLLAAGAAEAELCIVDYNAQPGAARAHVHVQCLQQLEQLGALKFDLVIASGILEHLPEPMTALARLLDALEPEGVMYARTPAVLELMRLAARVRARIDFTFPGHLHDLGQSFWDRVLPRLPDPERYALLASQPSLVETTMRRHPLRTAAAIVLKSPWTVLGSRWKLVGGWEVFIARK